MPLRYFESGDYLFEAENYDQAIVLYEQGMQLNPIDFRGFYYRGRAYHEKGDYDFALADFNRVIEINPNIAEAYNARGRTYNALSRYEEALEDFNQALEIDENLLEAYNNRGVSYYNLGEQDLAIADWDYYRRNSNLENLLVEEGNLAAESGDYESGIEAFTLALIANPDDADAYLGLGNIYYFRGDLELALDAYNHYINLVQEAPNEEVIRRIEGIQAIKGE